jgi:predicted membrane channel-forming protein YqfA (hemolysin III family)
MKTDPRSLIMAFAFFTILTDFLLGMAEYSQFTLSNTFPSVSSYLNYGTAWTTSLNDLGGNWSFLGYSFTFIEYFFVGLLSVVVFIVNIFSWIYLSISWVFTFINYPYSLLPSPLNSLFQISLYVSIGIAILFSIRILYTGLSNE